MSPFVSSGSVFTRALALGSVQHTAAVSNAALPMLSPALAEPRPTQAKVAPTIAAGLPHFSTGKA